MSNKKLIWVLVLSALVVGAGAYYTLKDKSIDVTTDKGIATTKELVTGIWFHSDTYCKGKAHFESVQEFSFGAGCVKTKNTIAKPFCL
jgi:hypothetical protein